MRLKKNKAKNSKIQHPRKSLLYLILGAILIFILIYYSILKFFPSIQNKYDKEIKKIFAPLDVSEMNILFITLDTTRADHIGCYGYQNVETPNLDKLAKNGVLFKNAIAQAPLTLPSHSSIFTGTYPFYHGVRDNGGFYLEENNITLAEILKEHGWATSAFIGAFVLDSRWGLDQGIDFYFDNFDFSKYKQISLDSVQRQGGEVIAAFFNWFETNYKKKFFTWIHLYDPHTPYDPPEPYKSKYSLSTWGLYDGEIAYVDSLIGKVLNKLREKNVSENTMIVLVGDHGECLGEHQENTHGFFIYDAAIHVPLIIHFPSSKLGGKQHTSQVETIDIVPTLLQILDLPAPNAVQGKSLIPLIFGKAKEKQRLAYSETYFPHYRYGWSELKCLRSSHFKYILAPRPELYDITHDPKELENIYQNNKKIAKKFEQELHDLLKDLSIAGIEEKKPQKLDEEAAEKLIALGYIGGFTSQSKIGKADNLSDPKDKIRLFNKIKIAEGFSVKGKLNQALEKMNEVITEDPQIMEARQVRAQIFLRMNKIEKAIEDCKEALKIDPDYEAAIFSLAHAYKRQKKYEDAIAGYERLIQIDSRDHKPYVNLGEIYLEIDDPDKAIHFLQKSIEIEPERSAIAHNLLGEAFIKVKLFDQAELEFGKALEIRPKITDAHYNLAIIYEEKKDYNRAIEEYQKEIELHPAAYPAHFNLGKLYGQLGDLNKQVEHYKEAIKYKKDFANGYLFLASAYLDLNKNFEEAIILAKKGLELAPESEYAPLAHYILADIYNRLGQIEKYHDELRKGKLVQQKIKNKN